MKVIVALTALLQLAYCGHVSVKLPYLNPASVTYVSGYQGHGAALTYTNGDAPLHYAAPAVPFLFTASETIPTKVQAHHVDYAATQVPAVTAVPFVKNLPIVSQVPVTKFEHHPVIIEKQVDVHRPAVSTKKFEVRRPAIEKQFYDIEQRTIIRPAGSALVELDEPTSKLQKGPAIVQPLTHGTILSNDYLVGHPQVAFPASISTTLSSTSRPILSSTSAPTEEGSVIIDNPELRSANFGSLHQTSSTILPEHQRLAQEQRRQFQLQQYSQLGILNEQQRLGQEEQHQFQLQHQSRSDFLNEQQQFEQEQKQRFQLQQKSQSDLLNEQQRFEQDQSQLPFQLQQQQLLRIGQEQFQLQQPSEPEPKPNQLNRSNQQQQFQPVIGRQVPQQLRSAIQQNQISGVESRSNGSPLETLASIASQEQGPSLIPSHQSSSEENQNNQMKLIDLLTARGGVTEIGLEHGGQLSPINAGQIHARVLSVTPAPFPAELAKEHISTKRVVVSRPIETLQELDVVEPATKVEKVALQHPTFIQTARLDHVQVHGSVPVVNRDLSLAVAQTAVPVDQKTILPAHNIYY